MGMNCMNAHDISGRPTEAASAFSPEIVRDQSLKLKVIHPTPSPEMEMRSFIRQNKLLVVFFVQIAYLMNWLNYVHEDIPC